MRAGLPLERLLKKKIVDTDVISMSCEHTISKFHGQTWASMSLYVYLVFKCYLKFILFYFVLYSRLYFSLNFLIKCHQTILVIF